MARSKKNEALEFVPEDDIEAKAEAEAEKKSSRFELDAIALADVEEWLCDPVGVYDIHPGYCTV